MNIPSFIIYSLLLANLTLSSAMTQAQTVLPNPEVLPTFNHVMVIVFENTSYSSALNQSYFSKLASDGALFTSFMAVAHPSQPNYIAMVGGDTLGVHGDGNVNLDQSHLGTLLNAKGLSWKIYAEDLPGTCFLGKTSGLYARKHVPLISFTNVQSNPSECAKIVNADELKTDLANHALPTYSMYIPNLNHDGHDTGVAYSNTWFEGAFKDIFSRSDVMKDTLFVITFDESENLLGKNQVFTVLYGANVMPGSKVNATLNHYSVLKMIEDRFQLGNLGRKDLTATPITGIWQ